MHLKKESEKHFAKKKRERELRETEKRK